MPSSFKRHKLQVYVREKSTIQLFEEIDKGLEKLKNHEVKGRLVPVFE